MKNNEFYFIELSDVEYYTIHGGEEGDFAYSIGFGFSVVYYSIVKTLDSLCNSILSSQCGSTLMEVGKNNPVAIWN